MTQTLPATKIRPGTQVTHRTDTELVIGEVVESDDWYDQLKLRGVATTAQRLVAWETGSEDGSPTMMWVRVADLAVA